MAAMPLAEHIARLAGWRVLVLGDVMLDEYLIGKAERMSREAPIPVLEFQSRRLIPGGAANPASNIVALGSKAIQVGIIGEDAAAEQLRAALGERGIDTNGLITVSDKPTTLKTRVLAQMGLRFPQQVARIDTLSREPIDAATTQRLLTTISQHLDGIDAILLSDYHNGLLTSALITQVIALARTRQVPLFADAQGQLQKYHHFGLVKCNADDAAAYLRRDLHTDADYARAAQMLCRDLALSEAMVITRGAEGASIGFADGSTLHSPAPQVSDVFDTVGAGDTWIAVMLLARLARTPHSSAAQIANAASGIVVRHVGNYTPTPHELVTALTN